MRFTEFRGSFDYEKAWRETRRRWTEAKRPKQSDVLGTCAKKITRQKEIVLTIKFIYGNVLATLGEKTMNAASLVRNECANFNGGCIFKADQICPVVDRNGKCNVSKSVLTNEKPESPIDYFTACLAPLAVNYPEYADAVVNYQHRHGGKVALIQRFCDCGEQIGKGQRFCDNCKKKNRKESFRVAQSKKRKQLLTS